MGRITGLYYRRGLLLALAGLKRYYKYVNIFSNSIFDFISLILCFILLKNISLFAFFFLYLKIYFIISILFFL
jgi:hypothetical protein